VRAVDRYAGPLVPRRPDMPPLRREALSDDPIEQFEEWYAAAAREVPLADAMTLATVDADGAPDARMVLLKGFGPDGFRFFTNLDSAKARQLRASPRVALVVYWRELDRQVRIRGDIAELPGSDSDAYFATRTRDSQIGAWASPQSQPLPDRASLDGRARETAERFSDRDVPRPPFWGGFVVLPREIEFWQGQVARLHDRFRYRRAGDGWQLERLAP
jgi:pyridoxamine 5'-phosphate oxidase